MPDFTTGPATLPDVGKLFYNDCTFSPLFETSVNGTVVKDAANRTTKFMDYTITADGYVTMPDNASDTVNVMDQLRKLLTAQGGKLIYKGRGNDITVNHPGSNIRDVAWGPVPELLEFQPLGGGRSAKIKWQVKTRIPELLGVGRRVGPVLQFNEETSVTYDDAGFSTLGIKGTLEIPLTRVTQQNHTVTQTVDQFRQTYLDQVANSIDLTRFRVTRRDFQISRDKRTMEWDFQAEEFPYMGLPRDVTVARGTFTFRPAKAGVGLCNWLCTLRCTYTVRKDRPRRVAWFAFLALLRERMIQSQYGVVPPPGGNQNPGAGAARILGAAVLGAPGLFANALGIFNQQNQQVSAARKAWLIDFSGDEGLYLDSKTVTFSATWRLITTFGAILAASGLWRQAPGTGGNNWALRMRDIQGWTSWSSNVLDPSQDVIVDFGFPG